MPLLHEHPTTSHVMAAPYANFANKNTVNIYYDPFFFPFIFLTFSKSLYFKALRKHIFTPLKEPFSSPKSMLFGELKRRFYEVKSHKGVTRTYFVMNNDTLSCLARYASRRSRGPRQPGQSMAVAMSYIRPYSYIVFVITRFQTRPSTTC